VHAYDSSRSQPLLDGPVPVPAGIPGMRQVYERPRPSATPIYDALCAEYRRLFRALPGDRSGEEDLRMPRFDTIHGVGVGIAAGLGPAPGGWLTDHRYHLYPAVLSAAGHSGAAALSPARHLPGSGPYGAGTAHDEAAPQP
jgi:hypothetical protein